MLRVGITGGIGSGKSVVCRIFEVLGIPVSYADAVAKQLMEADAALVAGIKNLFGEAAYESGRLNRAHIGALAFDDAEKLAALNALVHPATILHSRDWFARQTTPYAIKEAALFFESGSEAGVDVMVGVSAPKELRIARAMQRSGLSGAEVLARMSRQMDEEEKMRRCDFVVVNDGSRAVVPQALELHGIFPGKSAMLS